MVDCLFLDLCLESVNGLFLHEQYLLLCLSVCLSIFCPLIISSAYAILHSDVYTLKCCQPVTQMCQLYSARKFCFLSVLVVAHVLLSRCPHDPSYLTVRVFESLIISSLPQFTIYISRKQQPLVFTDFPFCPSNTCQNFSSLLLSAGDSQKFSSHFKHFVTDFLDSIIKP